MSQSLRIDRREHGTGWIVLTRPERHNAMDDVLMKDLTAAIAALGSDATCDAIVLAGEGKSFSAGADLDWMKRAASQSRDENIADAATLSSLMHTLDTVPKPTIAAVHGAAYGGGVGLVCCCDIAIAVPAAKFALTEVRLGLVPAVISPYVIAAIGARAARRYFQTAEMIDAAEALRIGLIQEIVEPDALQARVLALAAELKKGAPGAKAGAKALIAEMAAMPAGSARTAVTTERIADIRAGAEAREGLDAFFSRRKPSWS